MKNYISRAKTNGVHIYTSLSEDKYISKYRLIHDNKYVEIERINGRCDHFEIEKDTIKELDRSLEETLDFYKDKVNKKINESVSLKQILLSLHLTNAILNWSFGNIISACCWTACTGLVYLQIHNPLMLKRELKLVSWINDNKDKVNEVIREEVDSKRETSSNTNTLNMITPKYPTDLVPYSESMYEEGISLNNIDELTNKQLRGLKRKVLRKERRK